MNDILDDLSPEKLIRANEENLASWIPVFGKLGKACIDEPRGVKRSITDLPFSLFNSIMDAELEVSEVEPVLQALTAEAKQKGMPLLWWIGPSTRPLDLASHLMKYGFVLDENIPGMSVDLAKLQEKPAPAGLEVEVISNEADYYLWAKTMSIGSDNPPDAYSVFDTWDRLMRLADPDQVKAFLGRLDGEPVAASLLNLGGGVAGIYAVGTIPSARRKGIGRYITQVPLCLARDLGYRVGILQSSEMGYNVYRSLGFDENFRMEIYRWKP